MMVLPARSARCVPPIPRPDRMGGHLLPGEESASLLLWAWPRLIGWPRRINWIFSPVVGNIRYPGDLWGIDSRGELLIVETKLDRAGRPQNPLEDFVPYCASCTASKLCCADSLERRWRELMRREDMFLESYGTRLLTGKARLTGTFPGVLPYSRHRDAVWRWRTLFRERIVPLFRAGTYRRAVERSLRARRKHGDPSPLFVGVIATVLPKSPGLSKRGQIAFLNLVRCAGRQRVLLRAMRVESTGSGYIRIRCWTMKNEGAG